VLTSSEIQSAGRALSRLNQAPHQTVDLTVSQCFLLADIYELNQLVAHSTGRVDARNPRILGRNSWRDREDKTREKANVAREGEDLRPTKGGRLGQEAIWMEPRRWGALRDSRATVTFGLALALGDQALKLRSREPGEKVWPECKIVLVRFLSWRASCITSRMSVCTGSITTSDCYPFG